MERKRYPLEFKQQLVIEVKETGNVALVAKRHGVSNKTLYSWIKYSNNISLTPDIDSKDKQEKLKEIKKI